MTNNKRIAKNTLFLYIRMSILMLIGLYTSRVTLQVLGNTDFGTYNVVAGVVVLFTFFNNALTAGVQRYLNFYLGEDDTDDLKKIFSQSVRVFIILSVIIVIISETVGIILLEYYMDIPADRMNAARIVYQFSIITTVLSMMRIPFNATIIAYEKMSFYAYMSVIEGALKLGSVFALMYVFADKLVFYGLLQVLVAVIILLAYWGYAKKEFSIVNFKKYNDKTLLRGMLSFSGWNILGSASNTFTNQGLTIVINHFFGVGVNAALGVANQANNAIYQFLSNFQTAFNPQIVKSYAQGDKEYLDDLVIKTSKYSFYLLYFIIQPFIVNINYVLVLWLKDVPEGTNIFLTLLCIFTLLDALAGPLWMLVEAEGNIKKYQIVGAITGFVELAIAYIALLLGASAYSCILIRVIGNFAFTLWRLVYLKDRVNFPSIRFVKDVFGKVAIIVLLGFSSTYILHHFMTENFGSLIINCLFSCIILLILYIFVGMTKSERISIFGVLKNKVKKS